MGVPKRRFFEQEGDEPRDKKSTRKKQNLGHVQLNPEVEKALVEAKAKAPPSAKIKLNLDKYTRGKGAHWKDLKTVKDRKVRGKVKEKEKLYKQTALTAAKLEKYALPTEGGILEADEAEETKDIKQEEIVGAVDILSSRKAFDLKLPVLGPYSVDYSHNGRYLLLGGRKGHLALVDWNISRLIKEFEVRETTRDVKFLHNEQFFAAAQKKYIYIYNKNGAEVHCLKEFRDPLKLEFLRHHFLLASTNKRGILHYQDTSTGKIVVNHKTHLGPCDVIRVNSYNAVLSLGHSNGTVTMWSPNLSTPLVTMLCHRGPLTALAIEGGGNYMVTAGTDSRVKIWDIRKLKEVHSYASNGVTRSLDISQKGLLAVGTGRTVEVWKDAFGAEKQQKPYMRHRLLQAGSTVQDLSYCPYEDILGIGHSLGFTSMIVPGSGEPNFDSFVANPFETTRQRHEAEVHALLDKLQPEMIMLEPDKVGAVRKNKPVAVQAAEEDEEDEAKDNQQQETRRKHKMKGRSKPGRIEAKKQEQAFSAKRSIIRQQNAATNKARDEPSEPLPRALARFEA